MSITILPDPCPTHLCVYVFQGFLRIRVHVRLTPLVRVVRKVEPINGDAGEASKVAL